MFPHDHPWLDGEPELMNKAQLKMKDKLDFVIQDTYTPPKVDKGKGEGGGDEDGKEGEAEEKKKDETAEVTLIEKIHAFMFIYDSSNKRTFQSMMCMVDVITALETSKKKGGGAKSGLPRFYPKKIIVGNKKDLKKNKDAGVITDDDVSKIEGIKIKEVSALTNIGIIDVFKALV